jgi:hypothetical protein
LDQLEAGQTSGTIRFNVSSISKGTSGLAFSLIVKLADVCMTVLIHWPLECQQNLNGKHILWQLDVFYWKQSNCSSHVYLWWLHWVKWLWKVWKSCCVCSGNWKILCLSDCFHSPNKWAMPTRNCASSGTARYMSRVMMWQPLHTSQQQDTVHILQKTLSPCSIKNEKKANVKLIPTIGETLNCNMYHLCVWSYQHTAIMFSTIARKYILMA